MNRISIITPCYNDGCYIPQAIRSLEDNIAAISHAHPHMTFEHVIIDNNSTDAETVRLLDELRNQTTSYDRQILTSRRKGPATARNVGIDHATGDWIGFLDADDSYKDRNLLTMVDAALAYPDAQWVVSDTEAFYPDGRRELKQVQCRQFIPAGSIKAHPIDRRTFMEVMAGTPQLFLGAMMVRKDLLDRVGRFDERLICSEDWYLTLSLSAEITAIYNPHTCLSLRRGHNSLTQRPEDLGYRNIKATLWAIRERRFRAVRKTLRWTLIRQLVNIRTKAKDGGLKGKAFRYGMLAWVAAPEELSLLGQAASCLFAKRSA